MASRRDYWRELVAEFGVSGESQRNFADRHGVNLGTFRYWLYRLRAERGAPETGDDPSTPDSGADLPQLRRLAAELQKTQERLARIERQVQTSSFANELRYLEEDLAQLRQEVFTLSQSSGEDAFVTKTEPLDLEIEYKHLTFEEQSERDLVEALLSDPEFQQPLTLEDFNDRLTAIEAAFEQEISTFRANIASKLKAIGEKARDLINELFYEHIAILDANDDVASNQMLDPRIFQVETTIEEEAERQLVDTLLSDPPVEEPLFLEDLDQRLTAIEKAWEGLGESGRLSNFHRRLRKLETVLIGKTKDPTLQQVEERILNAQKRGAHMVHRPLKLEIAAEDLCVSLRRVGYFLSPSTASDILHQLQIRRILVLQGPPGTGKSRLARLLPQFLIPATDGRAPFTEASMRPEASSFDVIGGLRPYGKRFGPHLGYLTEAVLRSVEDDGKHWLILDEINRGDISAALSPCLDGLNLDVGLIGHDYLFMSRSISRDAIPMPGNFRIIGTMNTFDEDQLFRFSEALSRRIGFVHVTPLSPMDERALADDLVVHPSVVGMSGSEEILDAFKHDINLGVDRIFEAMSQVRALAQRDPRHLFRYCEIGTGVVLDALRQFCLRLTGSPGEQVNDAVDLALASVLLAHLVGRDREVIEALRDDVFLPRMYPRCRQILDKKLNDLQIF